MNADKMIQNGCPQRNANCEAKADGPFSEWAAKLQSIRVLVTAERGVTVGLVGIRGNGKTQAAAEIMRETMSLGKTARYVSAQAFFIELRSSFRQGASTTESEVVEKYRRPILLIIDECDKRGGSEWENNVLFGLLDMRHGDMSDTILIANQTTAVFTEAIGPSIMSRMLEGGGMCEFTWEDFRSTTSDHKPKSRGFIEPRYALKRGDPGYDYRKDPDHSYL